MNYQFSSTKKPPGGGFLRSLFAQFLEKPEGQRPDAAGKGDHQEIADKVRDVVTAGERIERRLEHSLDAQQNRNNAKQENIFAQQGRHP